jgi:hypothetical protein
VIIDEIAGEQGQKPWAWRGAMKKADELIIRATADKNRAAARIFVTGEVSETCLGERAVEHLLSINEVYYENGAVEEPLFTETRDDTIRMTRFDPDFVWRCFHPDILTELFKKEIARLGVEMDPWF